MEPTVTVETPYSDPPGTFRATHASEMYTLAWAGGPVKPVYDLGTPPTYRKTFKLRNNTVSHELRVTMVLPSYIKIDLSPNMVLAPEAEVVFVLSLNEPDVRQKAVSGKKFFEEELSINVVPLNVTGPVFVKTNLPPLTL